jgi:hypothetical protein
MTADTTDLFTIAETTQEESHAQDKEQVRQNGAEQRSLDNTDLILQWIVSASTRLLGGTSTNLDKSNAVLSK